MRTSVLRIGCFKQLLFICLLCCCLYLCVSQKSLMTLVFLCVTSAARSTVLEWQVVTVAWFHSSKSCMGAPTILLRPITTALFPATETPVEKRHKQIVVTFDIFTHCNIIVTDCSFFRVIRDFVYPSVWLTPCSHLACRGWGSCPDPHGTASPHLCWSVCKHTRMYKSL